MIISVNKIAEDVEGFPYLSQNGETSEVVFGCVRWAEIIPGVDDASNQFIELESLGRVEFCEVHSKE